MTRRPDPFARLFCRPHHNPIRPSGTGCPECDHGAKASAAGRAKRKAAARAARLKRSQRAQQDTDFDYSI